MEVKYKGETYTLGKKVRKVGGEAPACRVQMLNAETKIIGMMAPKTQIILSLPNIKDFNNGLFDILKAYKEKTIVYIMTSSKEEDIQKVNTMFHLHDGFISTEYSDFAPKFGVSMNDKLLAKALFIIDKEGVFKYAEVPSNVEARYDLQNFEMALDETINFKQKGHVHENWMSV